METNKNQYKVVIKELTETFKMIDLPYYAKNNVYAFKVISQDKTIVIEYSSTDRGIQTKDTQYTTAFNDNVEVISEEEFWLLYNKTKEEVYATAISG